MCWISDMNSQQTYTAANPTLSDFTYVCVQPMTQSLPVDTTQLAYGQQCQPYYYSVETSDFYGADYQPNYVSTTAASNNLTAQASQTAVAPLDVVSTTPATTPYIGTRRRAVAGTLTPPVSSDYSSPGCSTSPSSTASLSSVSSSAVNCVQLPPEIQAKVFRPPSALNPTGHQRTPRRNKLELSAKRVHHCTEPGKCFLEKGH